MVVLIALAGSTGPPRFEDYPATETLHGRAAEPNLASHPEARRYRTVLRRAAQAGPNFAGQFTLVRIGCGTGCAEIAVVDAKDGSVSFPQGLRTVQWAGWWHEPYGLQYRLSSRLAVVYGVANEEETVGHYGVSYFVWNGKDFELILFKPRDGGRPPK
jgi:hypothetical protein